MLFVFTLVLATAAVIWTALFSVGFATLQTTLLLSVGAVLGVSTLIGLVIALSDRRHSKTRSSRLQALREGPSALRWAPPATIPDAAVVSPPSVEKTPAAPVPSESVSSTPEPVPAFETEPAPVFEPEPSPVLEPEAVFETEPAPEAVFEPEPAPAFEPGTATVAEVIEDKTIDFQEQPPPSMEPEPAPIPEEIAPSQPPADQLLHLDPEFELSEVKRVLRIWQMTFEEEGLIHGQAARWSSSDGTSIDLFTKADGFPYLEIRGPMAEEFAEFLPQDLPVHPILPEELLS